MVVISQPWFSAVGHPAQSLLNLAKIIGKNNEIMYLISMISDNQKLDLAVNNLKEIGSVFDYQVQSSSVREGTIKALKSLKLIVRNKGSIDYLFFLDAHLVFLAILWPFYASSKINRLGVVYLKGPERIAQFWLIKFLVFMFLSRKDVELFLRTKELVDDWKRYFPRANIKCLPSLEIPPNEQYQPKNKVSSDILHLGVLGQIRRGKSLEWLVPLFKKAPSLGELTITGAFSSSEESKNFLFLNDFKGFNEEFLSEERLLELASEQDYLLMLYDDWDHRMEGAIMFLSARVNRPVIVFDRGWCGRMVNTYKNGLLAPEANDDFSDFIKNIPKCGSKEYIRFLEGVAEFRRAHTGESIRKEFLDIVRFKYVFR
jgi:glycosyltransferase involved in cell wall biosynthesis